MVLLTFPVSFFFCHVFFYPWKQYSNTLQHPYCAFFYFLTTSCLCNLCNLFLLTINFENCTFQFSMHNDFGCLFATCKKFPQNVFSLKMAVLHVHACKSDLFLMQGGGGAKIFPGTKIQTLHSFLWYLKFTKSEELWMNQIIYSDNEFYDLKNNIYKHKFKHGFRQITSPVSAL